MFYGSGAGKLPTASAVVADIVEIAKHLDENIPVEWRKEKLELADYRQIKNKYFFCIGMALLRYNDENTYSMSFDREN